MTTQSLRNARKSLNAFQISDRAYATTIYVVAFVGGLSHLLMIVCK